DPAVEHSCPDVAEGAQQPPEPARDRTAGIVVGDHHVAVADSQSAHCSLELLPAWQWVPARAVLAADVSVKIYEDGTGNVSGVVGGLTGAAVQVPADVDDAKSCVRQVPAQPFRRDDRPGRAHRQTL